MLFDASEALQESDRISIYDYPHVTATGPVVFEVRLEDLAQRRRRPGPQKEMPPPSSMELFDGGGGRAHDFDALLKTR